MGLKCHFMNITSNEHMKIANIHDNIEFSDPVIFRHRWIKLLTFPLQRERYREQDKENSV